MRRTPFSLRPLLLAALLTPAALLAWAARPASSQSGGALRLDVFKTNRELFGHVWGAGNWIGFGVDESERDLNGDGDTDDTVMMLFDQTTRKIQETGLAIDTAMADETDDWLIAFAPKGNLAAIQVSEMDQGNKDLDGTGKAQESVLFLYNTSTRAVTNLGVSGKFPTFLGDKLFFVQEEKLARKDLNGDGDTNDSVLCDYDLNSRQVESFSMEASAGFKTAGDWIAAETSETAQGAHDLNGDGDTADVVVQLYQVSTRKWTSTGLAMGAVNGEAGSLALTPRLLAVGVPEASQANKDLNDDKDTQDTVCEVWDLSSGKVTNTAQDCSEGLVADGIVVGMVTTEASQANKDLNNDGDSDDAVAQCYVLGAPKPINIGRDATGGMVAGGGKIAFVTSEEDNGKKDLNGDQDTDDFVLQDYDPVKNVVFNTRLAVDGDPVAAEGKLAWKVLESDQGNKDLNRDRDMDDSVLFAMDLATNALTPTGSGWACGDAIAVTSAGIAFSTFESDQGNQDLNMDGDTDDEILMVARFQ